MMAYAGRVGECWSPRCVDPGAKVIEKTARASKEPYTNINSFLDFTVIYFRTVKVETSFVVA
jgi:hypothetical protein